LDCATRNIRAIATHHIYNKSFSQELIMKKLFTNLVQAGICTTLICSANAAVAGQLTGFYAVKKTVKVGELVSLVASGTAQCGVMINDGNGKTWPIALTDTMNPATKSFGASYNKPGKFHLTATGKGGAGKLDCNAAPVLTEDVTVLGAPPPCTFDTAVQKEYLEVGIKVKTCEISATPPIHVGTRADAPPVVVSGNPGLSVSHTKITSLQVSGTQLKTGDTLTVKVFGTGLETQCPTTVYLDNVVGAVLKSVDQVATGAWPRVSGHVLPKAGKYFVHITPAQSAQLSDAEKVACGFKLFNGSGIDGDPTTIEVTDIPK
jgi:hypothetical protein